MSALAVIGAMPPAIAMQDTETYTSDSAVGHTLDLTLNTDGTFDVDDTANGSEGSGNWLWPPGAASSDYAVTATLVSGTAASGTFGSSLDLGTARTWSVAAPKDPGPSETLVFDLDFTWNGGAKGHTVRVSLTAS